MDDHLEVYQDYDKSTKRSRNSQEEFNFDDLYAADIPLPDDNDDWEMSSGITQVFTQPQPSQAPLAKRSYKRRRSTYKKKRKYNRTSGYERKVRKLYPSSEYYRTYNKRNDDSKALYGSSYKNATDAQKFNRTQNMMIGSGKYDSKRFVASARQTVGGFLKKAKVGEMLQREMIQGMGLYTGAGGYASNALIGQGNGDSVPSFGNEDPENGIFISKKEYICDIFGPPVQSLISNGTDSAYKSVAPFVSQTFSINPGLDRVFPWLSQLAANYDEYEIKQLIFTFVSTIVESSNTANGQVGMIVMATQYDAGQSPFRSLQEMLQANTPSKGKITEDQLHGVECDPDANSGNSGKYVRTGPSKPGQDINKFDIGFLQLALCNMSATYANVSIGQLYVSYTIQLRKPKLYTTLGNVISKDIYLAVKDTESLGGFIGYGAQYSTSTMKWWNGSAFETAYPGTNQAAIEFKNARYYGEKPSYLSGQQNNLGTQIRCLSDTAKASINEVGVVTVTAAQTIRHLMNIVFPATYSGNVRILISVEEIQNNLSLQSIPYGLGNVSIVSDLYGGTGSPISDAPLGFISAQSAAGTTGNAILIVHARIEIATNGVDNVLVFPFSTTTIGLLAASRYISQTYVEIAEYNATFSNKYLGTGFNDTPLFVDENGVSVVVNA